MDHYCITVHKTGADTGRHLISATCGCGWKSGIWYGHEAYVAESYARHERDIEAGRRLAAEDQVASLKRENQMLWNSIAARDEAQP